MKINSVHGNGGRETALIINDIFMKYYKNEYGSSKEDSVILDAGGKIAFTTDSFVVRPIFFNGGDIGRLAVCGTVNDLLTCGSEPKFISAGFIIEEGFDTRELEKIARSMSEAASEAGVFIVTGDTKVIDGGGGIYINTSGIGRIENRVSFSDAKDGDSIIITGTLGDHHACITSARMGVKNNIKSDVAPLCKIVSALLGSGITLHGMRDVTRGGLASCLNEIAGLSELTACIYEKNIPVSNEVSGLCEILGLDPLYMANEGKMLIAVAHEDAGRAVEIIRKQTYGENAAILGEFKKSEKPELLMITKISGVRKLPVLAGESLPRIC